MDKTTTIGLDLATGRIYDRNPVPVIDAQALAIREETIYGLAMHTD